MPRSSLPTFEITRLAILDPEGRVDASLDPGLPDERLLDLYRWMLLSRELDDRMLKLQRQGRLGTFPPTTGQEAVSVGAALAMEPQDWLVPTYREVGARLVRGEPPLLPLLYYKGFEEGNRLPRTSRVLPAQVVLGTQALHATGIAYALSLQQTPSAEAPAVLTFFGDGASSEGDVHEALNCAGAWKSPVVFVCVNNQYAISTPLSRQTAAPAFAYRATGYGMPGVQVDGNDPLAVYTAVREALTRARQGEGPTLVEALTYRLLMHTTADDPSKYRDEKVTQEMWKLEPMLRTRRYLESRGLLDEARETALRAEARGRVEEAVRELEAFKPDRIDAPFDNALAEPGPTLEAQRRRFLELNA
jgi:pyruvate dehydrogenase E1 component alpha subunit